MSELISIERTGPKPSPSISANRRPAPPLAVKYPPRVSDHFQEICTLVTLNLAAPADVNASDSEYSPGGTPLMADVYAPVLNVSGTD